IVALTIDDREQGNRRIREVAIEVVLIEAAQARLAQDEPRRAGMAVAGCQRQAPGGSPLFFFPRELRMSSRIPHRARSTPTTSATRAPRLARGRTSPKRRTANHTFGIASTISFRGGS